MTISHWTNQVDMFCRCGRMFDYENSTARERDYYKLTGVCLDCKGSQNQDERIDVV